MSARTGGWVLSPVLCLWLAIDLFALPAQARYGGGLGTADQPYLISTAAQLNAIGSEPGDWDKCFKLRADIDLRDLGAIPFRRIGTPQGGSFMGVFDGNSKTISNLRLYSEDESYLGMFGLVDAAGARIVDLTLLDPNVAGDNGRYVAALVGLLSQGTVTNCHVKGGHIRGTSLVGGLIARRAGSATIADCTAAGTVRGSSRVGGLIGANFMGDVARCQAAGEVRGDASSWSIGGLMGENESASVAACCASSKVEGDRCVGGLIGKNFGATVSRCRAAGTVQGNTEVGGLIGRSAGAKAIDCYAMAGVTATVSAGGLVGSCGPSCDCEEYIPSLVARCYAAGHVQGGAGGGLVGVSLKSSVEASFWDIEATGCATSAGGEGKMAAQMCSLSTYLNAGWDFVTESKNGTQDIWYLPGPADYPRLTWEAPATDLNVSGHLDF
jgi:hypothetical protein